MLESFVTVLPLAEKNQGGDKVARIVKQLSSPANFIELDQDRIVTLWN
jgi:hypothetical protein